MSIWERLSPLEKGVTLAVGVSLAATALAVLAVNYSLRNNTPSRDLALEQFLSNNNPKVTVSTAGYIGPHFESVGDGKVLFEPQSGTNYLTEGAFVFKNEAPQHATVRIAEGDTVLSIGGVIYRKFTN